MREQGGWSRDVVVAANQLRAAPPPRDAAAMEPSAMQLVVFSRNSPKKNHISYGDRLHGARHREGGGGSKLVRSHHHLPRPAPLFPHLNEARRTHAYL